jgi:hypothetical protein
MTLDADRFVDAFASSVILLIALLVVAQLLAPDFVPFLFNAIPGIVSTGAQILVAIILVLLAFELLDL